MFRNKHDVQPRPGSIEAALYAVKVRYVRSPSFQPDPLSSENELHLHELNRHVQSRLANLRVRLHDNLTIDQRAAIISLQAKRADLVVRPGDKSAGICIMSRDWYHKAVTTHLQDTNTYQLLQDTDPVRLNNDTIQRIRAIEWPKLEFMDKIRTWLETMMRPDAPLPRLYCLPKLSKITAEAPFASRPICSNHSSVTRAAALFISAFLQPLLADNGFMLKDTMDAVTTFATHPTWEIHPGDSIASFDAVSLYTFMPNHMTKHAVIRFIASRATFPTKHTKNQFLTAFNRLLGIILTDSYLSYEDKLYRQAEGLPMGICCAVELASVFMYTYLRPIISRYADVIAASNGYLDDGIALIRGNTDRWNDFMTDINNIAPRLRFTTTVSQTSLPFLDLELRISTGHTRLQHKCYVKPLSLHLFIPFKSAHHPSQLSNFAFGETLRFARNSTQQANYIDSVHALRAQLLARGYPAKVIDPQLFRFNYNDRLTLFQPRTSHRPAVIPVIVTFFKHWRLIQLVTTIRTHLQRLHPTLPRAILAWTRARNLQATVGAQW